MSETNIQNAFKFNKFCKNLGFSKQFKTNVTKIQMPYLSFEL